MAKELKEPPPTPVEWAVFERRGRAYKYRGRITAQVWFKARALAAVRFSIAPQHIELREL